MSKNSSGISRSNFYPAFLLLNPEKRRDLSIIYSFARIIDDIADDEVYSNDEKKNLLDGWRVRIEEIFNGEYKDSFSAEIANVVKKYNLNHALFMELIDGVSMDVGEVRYQSFEELKKYIYKVAVVPGILTLDILEYHNEDRYQLAEYLGCAVQLTNIIRDVYEDARNDRFYIPSQDMDRFYIKSDFIKNGGMSDNFLKLMDFEYERACFFYENSSKLLKSGNKKKLKVPLVMMNIYFELLKEIRKNNFDTRKKNPKISIKAKLKAILKSVF